MKENKDKMKQFNEMNVAMSVALTVLVTLVCLGLLGGGLLGCGDDAKTSAEGKGCANVGQYSCFDNTVHLCRFKDGKKFWEPQTDCGASSEPTCTCILYQQDLGMCTTGGSSDPAAKCQ